MCRHGNEYVVMATNVTITTRKFQVNNGYGDSVTTPMTRAPREGQGPSTKYTSRCPFSLGPLKYNTTCSGIRDINNSQSIHD